VHSRLKETENTSGVIYPRAVYPSYPPFKYLHQLQKNRLFLTVPQSGCTSNTITHDKNKNKKTFVKIFFNTPSTFFCIMRNLLSVAIRLPLHRGIAASRENHSHRIKMRSCSTSRGSVDVYCARGHCTLGENAKQLKQEQYLRTPDCHGPLPPLPDTLMLAIFEEPICRYGD